MTLLRASLAAALAAAAISPPVPSAGQPIPLPGPPRPELKSGPGSGYRTTLAAMVRTLRPGYGVTPILSCGDTLVAAQSGEAPFTFTALPDGIGAMRLGPGVVQAFVTHELQWSDGLGGARVSRLNLDTRTLGVLAADYVVDGSEGYERLCAASLADPRSGFLQPRLLINEETLQSPRGGMVAAVDVRAGTVADLPWLGRFSHESTLIVPVTGGKIVAILTEDGYPGESQLYMYLADTDGDFLAGRGRLHVLRAEGAVSAFADARLASSVTRARARSGRFVPLPSASDLSALSLEDAAQRAGCLNFVRLEDAAVDRRRLDAFYFVDTGDPGPVDRVSGRRVTGNGRLYHVTLDPFDPTRIAELSVVLDGDEGDDLYRPDNLDTDETCVMIQEDPGERGLHPARILSYDLASRRLDPVAECAERDRSGEPMPKGVGGQWESTGILNVSELFGEDAWLLAVQAHTMRVPMFRRRGQGGQLLLLKGPRFPKKPDQ